LAAVAAVVDSAALVAQVLPEAQLPVPAQLQVVVGLAQLPVLARLQVVVRLVLEAAVPVEQLLSRQSFSAAMARSTP
jgi:hypothetical protein